MDRVQRESGNTETTVQAVSISESSVPIVIPSTKATVRLTETKARSLVKAIAWRLVATGTTILVSYFYLDDITDATEIGVIDCVGKLLLHYAYERGFTRIRWGYQESVIETPVLPLDNDT